MKNLFLLLLVFVSSKALFSQTMPVDKETGLITYTEIVPSDGADAKALYKAAQLWGINVYCRDKPFLQFKDDENHTLTLKPVVYLYSQADGITIEGYVRYTLTVECKDNKYKYTFTNFRQENVGNTNTCDGGALEKDTYECPAGLSSNKKLKEFWDDIKSQTNDAVHFLISDMKKSIDKTVHTKKSDW